ncbi:MAG TPA: ABC transporter substrate-binding protein [Chitinophagales bacterium]|nr:ABC transporter substrate-binding protein [Chitinophagales bacterium]
MSNKTPYRFLWVFVMAGVLFTSCRQGANTHSQAEKKACAKLSSLNLKYARGFTVDYYDGFKVITIRDCNDTARLLAQYVLMPAGKPMPVGFENGVAVATPVRKIACISTTHIAQMAKLGLTDSIAAVTNLDLINDAEVVEKVKRHLIEDIGSQEIDYEKLAALAPSFIITSGSFDGGDKMSVKLDALHIKQVTGLEYKEQEPLARAEWLLFIAAFYNREGLAEKEFDTIAQNYLQLKAKAAAAATKPTVFCNLPFKEIWYMPCGENYIARLIADAGGDFLWKDAKATNGLNLNLNYESVYNKAANADCWLVDASFIYSLSDLKKADAKNTFFKAYKTGQVYNYNNRETPAGGFDFWESGTVNPDKILADLIKIFHPGLLPGYQLYYYRRVNAK